MPLTQETFLGASIRNFSASLGWGSQPSTLEVGLVEDLTNGDNFNPPPVGSPVYFEYQDWHFGGLLQSYTKSYGQNGNPIYNVQVQDPRELLAGVQLILQDYSDTSLTSSIIPNIYNIYGYMENQYGFGSSQVNETGIPWYIIVQALSELQALYPIRFRGEYFRFVPFYGMTTLLPSYYRIGGDSISLLDFVNEICEAISADYFIGMTYAPEYVGYANNIGLHMISRKSPLEDDKIEEFVEGVEGAVAKEIGHELRNEVTTKFLTGGKINYLYYQTQQYTQNDKNNITYDNTIWPYWGKDCFDNLIIMNSDGTFHLDGRTIALETGYSWLINYPTDINEMRAAVDSQDSWEAYLWHKNDDSASVHYRKASILGVVEGWAKTIKELIENFATNADIDKAKAGGRTISRIRMDREANKNGWKASASKSDNISKIYEWIHHYATEYYGRKFMVRIPFVLGARVPETSEIRFSVSPVDGGFVDSAEWANAAWEGLIPFNTIKFTLEDGRIMSYTRFSRVDSVDFSDDDAVAVHVNGSNFNLKDLSPDDFLIEQIPNVSVGRMRENLWVKAELDPKLVFMDETTLFSPRVVITLPGRIRTNLDDFYHLMDMVKEIINNVPVINRDARLKPGYVPPVDSGLPTTTEIIKDFTDALMLNFGSDILWLDYDSQAAMPDLAAIALESNILRYGPWYAIGSAGKVEYEADETLVPWNYGGWTLLDLSGRSRVEDALSSLQVSEKGTVEFPGVPDRSLGEALLDSGPTVTDISVNIGEDGVTTRYNMSTWSWRFGRVGKYNLERLLRINKVMQKQRKLFREKFSNKGKLPILTNSQKTAIQDWTRRARRLGSHSSIGLLAGDVLVSGSGDTLSVKPNIAGIAGYRVNSQTNPDAYPTQAGMSLDGMFVPYTTATENDLDYANYLPKFETPEENATTPTVNDLNPFGNRGIAVAFPESAELPDNLNTELDADEYNGHVKGIGLKAPIIVGGWGYTTEGNPVPASTEDPTSFITNYKNRADLWKVGPLDIRWDDSKKLWTTISEDSLKIEWASLLDELPVGTSASCFISSNRSTYPDPVTIYDYNRSNHGLPGEILPVFFNSNANRFEVIGEHNLMRFCVTSTNITYGNYGYAVIHNQYGPTEFELYCKLGWAHNNVSISDGIQVICKWNREFNTWMIVGKGCP